MTNAQVHKHVFCFNPKDNGGESLSLTTEFFDNGDHKEPYMNQTLTLQSYLNSASFELIGAALTPEVLRKLANELESAYLKTKAKIESNKLE
jgi:hypothetical protein